jgi:hypothetical protein
VRNQNDARLHSALRIPDSAIELRFRFGLAQTRDAVAGFPLAAFLEKFGALEALQDIAFAAQSGRRAQTAML